MNAPDRADGTRGAEGSPRSFTDVSLRWFVRVRWAASLTALTLSIALVARGRPSAWPMLLSTLPPLVSNAWLVRRGERTPSDRTLLVTVLLDATCLTGWLALAGGPANPWSALYVVYVALSALLLPARSTAVVVALNALLYRFTFVLQGSAHAHGDDFGAHVEGMYVAYVVSSSLVAYFVSQVAEALRVRDAELSRARERSARERRVAALTTLAAGAAHELGSPLGTIAVAAKELERALVARNLEASLVEDAQLVRTEVDRCRSILDRMASRAGATVGEAPRDFTPRDLIQALEEAHGERHARVGYRAGEGSVRLPFAVVQSVVENLVSNALRATREGGAVTVDVSVVEGALAVDVVDEGVGMPPEVRDQAFDPFFTAGAEGEGMGLGLFLVETMVQALGGTVALHSEAGRGTTVHVRFPNLPPPAHA